MAGEEEEKATGARFDSPVSRAEECGLYLRVRGIDLPETINETKQKAERFTYLHACKISCKKNIYAPLQSLRQAFFQSFPPGAVYRVHPLLPPQ